MGGPMRHTLTLVIHPVRDVMRSRCTPSRWSIKSVRPFAPSPWSGIPPPLTAVGLYFRLIASTIHDEAPINVGVKMLKGAIAVIVLTIAAALVGGYLILQSGLIPANADAAPGPVETWMARTSLA